MNQKVVDIVTTKILELLAKGTPPWHAGWQSGSHRNLHTSRSYHGINVLILQAACALQEWINPLWMTYKQAVEEGGKVIPGQHGTPIVYWNIKKDEDEDKWFPLLRYYTVFNVAQIEGIPVPPSPVEVILPAPESVLQSMPVYPIITPLPVDRACYIPSRDVIEVPQRQQFLSSADMYATYFHECVHASGHSSRLNRPDVMSSEFGTQPYAKEELIAEIGSAFLCHTCGLEVTITNQAAYCASWLKALNDDRSMIITAATKATKAVNYLTNQDEENYDQTTN
jgi:antirestriction protein ArdC